MGYKVVMAEWQQFQKVVMAFKAVMVGWSLYLKVLTAYKAEMVEWWRSDQGSTVFKI